MELIRGEQTEQARVAAVLVADGLAQLRKLGAFVDGLVAKVGRQAGRKRRG